MNGPCGPTIARLAAAHQDTVRDVIHDFDRRGPACLDPDRAEDRPRHITDDDTALIIETARTRPTQPGRPFTCQSVRKLADHIATRGNRRIGRGRLRRLLHEHGITFQRTRT